MRIELSIRDRDDIVRDVAVVAPRTVELSSLAEHLIGESAMTPTVIWSGDRPLSPTTRVGDEGMRTGVVLSIGGPSRATPRPGVLTLHQVGGPQAGRVVPIGRGQFVIGRGTECDVTLEDPDASRQHAVLEVQPSRITIADNASTNGTTIDGHRVDGVAQQVRPGQRIRIGDSTFSVVGPADSPAAIMASDDGSLRLLRAPRHLIRVPDLEITMPVNSPTQRPRAVQWVTALLPAVAGGLVAWLMQSPQFLLFVLLSPVMLLSSSLGDRMRWRRTARRAVSAYTARAIEAEETLAAALNSESEARHAQSPDAAAVLRFVMLPGTRLWERRRNDPDALHVRVGTGDITSATTVRRGVAVDTAGMIHAVPVQIRLTDGPMGVCGPARMTDGVGRWLLGQLAALHSPADMSVALLLSDDRCERWEWARWLPHLSGQVAAGNMDVSNLVGRLQETVDQRHAVSRPTASQWSGPWLVLIVDRTSRLSDAAGLSTLLACGRNVGVTAICIDDDAEGLPSECRTVLTVSGITGSRGTVRDETGVLHEHVVLDVVAHDWAESTSRALAPFVDAGADGSNMLPPRCGLFESLGVIDVDADTIRRQWQLGDRAGRKIDATIGLGTDGPLRIDLVADGPHALVAGTTGSGKSELLQTFVASIAFTHSPDDVNFLLIDYKGGAAFAECERLPHTAGLVTDLDSYLTERALRSLDSELLRRERLLATAGANDLASYRYAKSPDPLPRLVIVVDEFATLADELPDFVRGLVGIAQRGRSLGIHLVLATQRPGSAVSPEIRANTSLRIALRVTDPAESDDVIGAGDAATISRDTPGCGYLRTGTSLAPFQAGFAARAPSNPDAVRIEELGRWRQAPVDEHAPDSTELALLVSAARVAAVSSGNRFARTPWLPPLPDQLAVDELDTFDLPVDVVPYAVVDLPDTQCRTTMTFNPSAGSSLLVAGAGKTGRSMLLASIAITAATGRTTDQLHIYVIDAVGRLAATLADLPHCATMLGPDDIDRTPLLLQRLEGRPAMVEIGRESPISLLLVDGWDTLQSRLADVDALECVDLLTALLRSGPDTATTTLVTGDRTLLTPRFAASFAQRILLRQNDRADFGLAGLHPREIPNELPPGRGVRAADGAMVQLVHAGKAPDLAAAQAEVERIALRTHTGTTRQADHAIRLRPLPTQVSLGDLTRPGDYVLGVGGDTTETLPFVPHHVHSGPARFLVAGPPRSGKSTVLCSLLTQARSAGMPTLVAATSRSPLAALARHHGVQVIAPSTPVDTITAPVDGSLLLVDDSENFIDVPADDMLTDWARASTSELAIVVAGRNEDLAICYRGIGAQVRRHNTGLLLRPGPVDGELIGVRLPRRTRSDPPGRGVLIGDPAWHAIYRDGSALAIQVAMP